MLAYEWVFSACGRVSALLCVTASTTWSAHPAGGRPAPDHRTWIRAGAAQQETLNLISSGAPNELQFSLRFDAMSRRT